MTQAAIRTVTELGTVHLAGLARALCRENYESPNTGCGCESSSRSAGSCCYWEWQQTVDARRICFANRLCFVILRSELEDRPDLLALHVERLCSTQPGTIGDAICPRG